MANSMMNAGQKAHGAGILLNGSRMKVQNQPFPTDFNIQYDDKNIYVAFRGHDGEPEKILRQAGVRDEFAGEMMGVNFDSYHDYRTGFEFTITAWGQKIDLVLFNPNNWDLNWNPVWKGKTGLEDSAWVAEYEIPLSQLSRLVAGKATLGAGDIIIGKDFADTFGIKPGDQVSVVLPSGKPVSLTATGVFASARPPPTAPLRS